MLSNLHDKACRRAASRRNIQLFVVMLLGLLLSACGERLVMIERTGFNLGIAINQDPSTPISANAGLDRKIMGIIPAREQRTVADGVTEPFGEAVNLISGFDLRYQDTQNLIGGELSIKSQFASGQAAKQLAENPSAANAVMDVTNTSGGFITPPPITIGPVFSRPDVVIPTTPPPRQPPAGAQTQTERAMTAGEVRQIQRALCHKPSRAGFEHQVYLTSGVFDEPTRAGIREFREMNELRPEPGSAVEMDQLDAITKRELLVAPACPDQYAFYFEFGLYDEPARIKSLQASLCVPQTGRFDKATRRAIKAFQQRPENSADLPDTGIVDFETDGRIPMEPDCGPGG